MTGGRLRGIKTTTKVNVLRHVATSAVLDKHCHVVRASLCHRRHPLNQTGGGIDRHARRGRCEPVAQRVAVRVGRPHRVVVDLSDTSLSRAPTRWSARQVAAADDDREALGRPSSLTVGEQHDDVGRTCLGQLPGSSGACPGGDEWTCRRGCDEAPHQRVTSDLLPGGRKRRAAPQCP